MSSKKEYKLEYYIWVKAVDAEDAKRQIEDILKKLFKQGQISDYDGPLEEVEEALV